MNTLEEKILKTLEFDKIIDMLCSKAVSPMGKELCKKIMPLTDIEKIKKLQTETSEAVSLITKNDVLVLDGIKDIRNILKRVRKNGVLSCQELTDVADFLNIIQKNKSYFFECHGQIKNLFDKIDFNYDLKSEIENKINFGEVLDTASEILFNIRQAIRSLNSDIKQSLMRIIESSGKMLQDNLVYMKNGRFCLAVKSEYRNSFNGIIHDQSSTGLTLFIEPSRVINLNNKLKKLEMDEQTEKHNILTELSTKVLKSSDSLYQNVYVIGQIDFIFARAKLAILMKATEPALNNNGYVYLRQARHPLIDPETVVPSDIYIGREFTILLISGPNTGGKTVSLKTVGLLTVMAQSGLHIPAKDSSCVNIFESIFVDIGDEQSIEQNLSTFSAHTKNINRILSQTNENSLVLLDELGAGTDPTEGAALAVAVLKHLLTKKSRVIVTSHYSELKLFALTTPEVENASCEFDIDNLSPTYKLMIGVPGKSSAFEIAEKIGLSRDIIRIARHNINQRDVFFEDVMKSLSRDKLIAEENRRETEKILSEVSETKKKIEIRLAKLEKLKCRELQTAKEKTLKIIGETQRKSKLLLKCYREKKFKDAEKLSAEIKTIKKEIESNQEILRPVSGKVKIKTDPLKVGCSVFSRSLNQIGIIEGLYQDYALVSFSNFKIKLPLSDLSLHYDNKCSNKITNSFASEKSFTSTGKNLSVSPRLDVRGCLCDEALSLLDKYIDDALVAHLDEVTIIHGKGTGALRSAVWDYLRKNSSVKSFRAGNFGEGEIGVTIVCLN